MTSKAHQAIALSHTNALEQDRLYQRIMVKWLRGYSLTDISRSEGGITQNEVMRGIEIKRVELAAAQKGEIDHIIAERIAGLKDIKREAFEYLDLFPEKAPQLLTVALRAEETQAKMQGVLSEKVMHLGRIEHTVKMYDFEDRTPGAIIIDAVSKTPDFTIQEEELPLIEETVNIDESRLAVISGLHVDKSEVIDVTKKKVISPTIVNSITIIRPGDEVLED